jgi:hypothetical protein
MLAVLLAAGCAMRGNSSSPYITSTSTVTAHRLNVRAEPSSNAHVIEVLDRGDSVDVLDRRYDWIRIRTPNRHLGWVYGAYLSGYDIPVPAGEPALRPERSAEPTPDESPAGPHSADPADDPADDAPVEDDPTDDTPIVI